MNDKTLPIDRIAEAIYPLIDGELDGSFLYSEVEEGVVRLGLYKEFDDRVQCYVPDDVLTEVIWASWNLSGSSRKWRSLTLAISGGHFEARLQYPGEGVEEEFYADRLNRVTLSRFGDKRIDYPSPQDVSRYSTN